MAMETKLPEIYPNLEHPISQADFEKCYDAFNKEYFGNYLPKVRLKFTPLAKNFYGKCHTSFTDKKIKDILITIATMTRKDTKAFVDTLLHEMIHVWQHKKAEETGDNDYTDDNNWAFIVEKDVHKRGHGKYFYDHAKRLNAIGFEIRAETGAQVEKEFTKEMWGIAFTSPSHSVLLYHPEDPTEKFQAIVDQCAVMLGADFYKDAFIFKTLDTNIIQFTRLTKAWALPKNQVNITYSLEAVLVVLKSPLTKIVKEIKHEDTEASNAVDKNMSGQETKLIFQLKKYRAKEFDTYLGLFLANSERFKDLPVKHYQGDLPAKNWDSALHMMGYKYGMAIPHVPKEVIDAVYKEWSAVDPANFADLFKYFGHAVYGEYQRITGGVSLRKANEWQEALSKLQKDFDKISLGRLDYKGFKKIAVKEMVKHLKAMFKKFKGEALDVKKAEEILVKQMLIGSFLEHNRIELINHKIKNIID